MKSIPQLDTRRLRQFWGNIKKSRGCWDWQGYILESGYGQFKIHTINYRVHRIVYSLSFGQPKGIVLHSCDNRKCCKPAHLIDGTNAQNSADMVAKGRSHHPKGDLHPHRKLNSHQAKKIRGLKGTCKDIALQYGVSPSTVSMIRTGKTWT